MLNWNAIDTVLLDMDGTLLDLKFDSDFYNVHLPRRLQEDHKITHDQALAAVNRMHEITQGQLSWYCTDHWSNELGVNLMALKAEVASQITVKEDAPAFLVWLQQRKLDVRLVTNAHPDVLALKAQHTDLERYIDSGKMICSHQFDYAKEHPGFWQAYASHAPFDADRTVLIDDNVTVLQTAKNFGVRYLIAPAKPDSSSPRIDSAGFDTIDRFEQLTETPLGQITAKNF